MSLYNWDHNGSWRCPPISTFLCLQIAGWGIEICPLFYPSGESDLSDSEDDTLGILGPVVVFVGFQAVNCQHNQPPIMFSQLAVVDCQIVSFSSLLGKKKVYGISLNGQVQRGHLNDGSDITGTSSWALQQFGSTKYWHLAWFWVSFFRRLAIARKVGTKRTKQMLGAWFVDFNLHMGERRWYDSQMQVKLMEVRWQFVFLVSLTGTFHDNVQQEQAPWDFFLPCR